MDYFAEICGFIRMPGSCGGGLSDLLVKSIILFQELVELSMLYLELEEKKN